MADAPVVHIGENSPEQIAYKLMLCIAANEGMSTQATMAGRATADRKWLLDTYAECLNAVRDPNSQVRGYHKTAAQRRDPDDDA